MTSQHAIVLTQAMARAIKDKRLPLETVLDYAKMRELFSSTDLAALWALQASELVSAVRLDSPYALFDKSWAHSANPEYAKELVSTLIPLSASEVVINHLRDQISLPEGDELEPTAAPVQVVDLNGSGVAVVLDRGAVQYLSQGANKFTVMRAVTQVMLKYVPIHELSQAEWFRRYLVLIGLYSPQRPPQPVIK